MNTVCKDALEYLDELDKNCIDLVLTDPPYITSRKSGLDELHKHVSNIDNNNNLTKTEEEWEQYSKKHTTQFSDKQKECYLKYGTIYGKKYAVCTNYGNWDSQFTMEYLELCVKQYYRVLKNGGTCIIFFDLWKISPLKEIMENAGFKQIRMIEWIKTNPQPLNSSVNYLTNCREIALLGVKGSKPTFHSKYDNGIYNLPLQGGKHRFHPTQKSIKLFEQLIEKHSNENDIVLDTFLGGGTSAIACKSMKRVCKGCEKDEEYHKKMLNVLNQ
jgi:site-specific DNA-methyltransferase (adenine-specific)